MDRRTREGSTRLDSIYISDAMQVRIESFSLRIRERCALPPPEKSGTDEEENGGREGVRGGRNGAVEFNKSRSSIVSINGFDTEHGSIRNPLETYLVFGL